MTQGGLEGGYGLYLRDGKPTFVYNYLSIDRPTFAAEIRCRTVKRSWSSISFMTAVARARVAEIPTMSAIAER